MRIAFNATSLLSPLTGIGQYSRHLANGLVQQPGVKADFFYGAFWQKEVREAPMPGAERLLPWIRNSVPYSYALRRLVQTQRFTAHTKRTQFDLYHEPNILPLPFHGPTVVTVHDLSWIRYPETHPIERVRAMNKYFERGLKQASLLLTDSEFVKQELVDVFGVPPTSIRAIPLGVEALFRPYTDGDTQRILSQHNLTHGRYLLAVGTLEPRKNLELAIQAYLLLPNVTRKHYPLVLVGMKGWLNSSLENIIEPLIKSGEVRRLGYLPRSDLAHVVAGASTLIYPSLYEGFGLPPLEAMACGVPVISSNTSALPEVIGDTGILINPFNAQELTDAVSSLIDDNALRKDLSEKALKRSERFHWKNCLSQTIDAYNQAIKRN